MFTRRSTGLAALAALAVTAALLDGDGWPRNLPVAFLLVSWRMRM